MCQLWSLLPLFYCRVYPTSPESVNLVSSYRYSNLRKVCVSISEHFLTWVNCDHCSYYFIAGSITLLLRCVLTWCSVIDIVFSEGCVWAYLNTFWHGSTVITAHTISLQRLSHFFWRCVSTLCIVMDIVFSKGCASAYLIWHGSTVITANSILLQGLSPFS